MKERDWQLYESFRRVYHFVEDNPLATPRHAYAMRMLEDALRSLACGASSFAQIMRRAMA